MDALSRRKFLIASGVVGAGALAAGATGVTWDQLHRTATARPRAAADGVLVIVTLYGGNDGLNMVVPVDDPAYHAARPDLAYDAGEVLPLADGLALNGSMKALKAQWDKGNLAVVRGVGYPEPSHSHFQSMAIWQTASPADPVPTGWIGRWLDSTGTDPVRALAIDSTLPPLMAGADSAGGTLVGPLTLPTGTFAEAVWTMDARGTSAPATTPAEQVRQSGLDLRTVATRVNPVLAGSAASADGSLAGQLGVVARLIAGGLPTRVYAVSLGSFDTHANEKATQSRLLGELDAALGSFFGSLSTSPHGAGVTALVHSEFGRRVAANASQGTDHGTAAPVLVLGPAVRGGFSGDQPSLTRLDDGDLQVSVDFRSVYATLLEGVLGGDTGKVLGDNVAAMPRLPLLA